MHTRSLSLPLFFAMMAFPSLLWANTTIELTRPAGIASEATTSTFNLEDCEANYDDNLSFTVTFGANDSLDYRYYKVAPDGSCPLDFNGAEGEGCTLLDAGTADVSDTYAEMTLAEFVDNTSCSELNDQTYVFRVVLDVFEDETDVSYNHSLQFATGRPDNGVTAAPALTTGQSTIKVTFEATGAESDTFKVYYHTIAPPESREPSQWEGASAVNNFASGNTLDGLTTGRTYYVAVVTITSEGNESLLSEASQATTSPTRDFFELYTQAGGGDGCESSQAGSPRGPVVWILLLLAGALLLRRHGKKAGALWIAAAVFALPSAANADLKDFEDSTGLFEVRVGGYTPEVDEAVNGTPYKDAFGESMLLLELELDRQVWRGIGTFGYAINVGYMDVDGRALDSVGNNSPDETSLNVIPVRFGVVYRFDYLAQHFDIPLTLSFKGGLDLYTWWVKAGENLATSDGRTGEGITMGYHYAAGVNLLLDWFDESSADGLALDFGVINSYVFAEIQRAEIDDFGDKDSMRFSDTHYTFGLAFEY